MIDDDTTRAYLHRRFEKLAPFDFVALGPPGQAEHMLEVGRREDGEIEVRVPGRPAVVAPLTDATRAALLERGFENDRADDPTRPWLHPVSDAGAAIGLVRAVLVEIFGHEGDAPLNLLNGSHRQEHEAEVKLAAVRERVAEVTEELMDGRSERDADGDFLLEMGDVQVVVAPRAMPGGPVLVRVFAVTNVGITVNPEVGLFLARLNFGLMFGGFALDVEHRSIWFNETLLGEQFTEEQLRFAIRIVGSTADEWDDRFKEMFGGLKYQEALAQHGKQELPPTKPGGGPEAGYGFYL